MTITPKRTIVSIREIVRPMPEIGLHRRLELEYLGDLPAGRLQLRVRSFKFEFLPSETVWARPPISQNVAGSTNT